MTTECQAFTDDLVAFVDGELPAARAAEVKAHVAGCAACQAERDALLASFAALDHLPGLAARPGWLQEVEAAVFEAAPATQPAGEVIRFPVHVVAGLVALAACLALAIGLVLSSDSADEPPAEGPIAHQQPSPLEPQGSNDPQERVLPPREQAPTPNTPTVDEAPQDPEPAPQAPEVREPELALLEDLSDEDLELLENYEVVANLETLDELDVLDSLEVLEDLEADELEADDA